MLLLFSCGGCQFSISAHHPGGILISDAFRTSDLPEVYISPYEIAYYKKDADGTPVVDILPVSAVVRDTAEEPLFPRTRFYDQFLPDTMQPLLCEIDYAILHGYSRFVFPLDGFTGKDLSTAIDYLDLIYRLDNNSFTFLSMEGASYGEEHTTYILVSLSALDRSETAEKFLEGLDAAKRIVASVPEGSSQTDTAIYLYSYLTEHVTYDYNDYYDGQEWHLLYDTLISGNTVCAGFAEALYYLYNLAGIPCITVEGYVNSPYADGGYHIWNVAEVDGTYYQFDATWDCGSPACEYRFCGVSTDEMLAYHSREIFQRDLAYLPECSTSLLPAVDSSIDTDKASALFRYLHLHNRWREDPAYTFTDTLGSVLFFENAHTKQDEYQSSMPYSKFLPMFYYFMTDEAAKAFCYGRFENKDGMLTAKIADEDTPYYRLTEVQEDGNDLTATVYVMTDMAHGSPVTVHCKLVSQTGEYYVASVSGLE